MADRKRTVLAWPLAFVLGMGVLSGALRAQEAPAPIPPMPLRRAAQPKAIQTQKDQVIQIFPLKHVQLNLGAPKVFDILNSFGRFAIDERTNSLIVQTTEDKISTIKAFISEIDVPAPESPKEAKEAKQIRLVWLVGGLADAGKPPPQDLEKVIAEIAKFGFGDLQMVAQTIIQTTPDGTFSINSNPTLGKDIPCNLKFQGQFQASGTETNQVQVQLSVLSQPRLQMPPMRPRTPESEPQPPGPPPSLSVMTDITTTISVPFGHPVVLCASPIESATSVFVIQVISLKAL